METSITSLISDHSKRLLNADNLSPGEAAQRRIELVALLGRINVEVAQAEVMYKRYKLQSRKESKSAVDAKILAESSDEYQVWTEKKAWQDTCKELIRSLRDFARTMEEELRLTPNQ